MKVSALEDVSIGVVAINKARGSKVVEVVLSEVSPFLDGELTDNADTQAVAGLGVDGRAFDATLTSTGTVPATWLPQGSNRVMPPDVRRGTKVRILQFANDPQYYWSELGLDDHLMKLETAIYAFSGTSDEGANPDATNTYYLEISTHDGLVALHTSAANNEPNEWDVQVNTKESKFLVTDSLGNYVTIESATGLIEAKNYKGTTIRMEGKDVTGIALGTTTWTCPTTNWKGNFNLDGNFTLKGNYTQTGNMAVTGDFLVNGNGEVTGNFTAGKVTSVAPISAPNV